MSSAEAVGEVAGVAVTVVAEAETQSCSLSSVHCLCGPSHYGPVGRAGGQGHGWWSRSLTLSSLLNNLLTDH